MKKKISSVICFILILLCFASPVSADLKISAPVTQGNVLSLLKKYDKDGYYLVVQGGTSNGGQGFMQWFQGADSIVSGINTCVHEQCHGCTHSTFGSEKIYKGNGKFFTIRYTDVFETKIIASSVPSVARTGRYNTYVANPSKYLTANQYGPYGLLDELTAYSYGMNNTVNLFKYYKKQGNDLNTWYTFILNGGNDRQAYSEFTFFILHYLNYAKNHYPSVYKGIMNNTNFKKAFKFIDKKFRKNIGIFEKDLNKLIRIMNKNGHHAEIRNDYFVCDYRGIGTFENKYNDIMKLIKKKKYRSIYTKLIN